MTVLSLREEGNLCLPSWATVDSPCATMVPVIPWVPEDGSETDADPTFSSGPTASQSMPYKKGTVFLCCYHTKPLWSSEPTPRCLQEGAPAKTRSAVAPSRP